MADLRLISNIPDEEFHRTQAAERRERLADRAGWSLTCLAANVLRVIRGAGKPENIPRQLNRAIEVMADYRAETGHGLSAGDIAKYLRLPTDADLTSGLLTKGQITEAHVARWESDGTVDRDLAVETIIRGALQIAASRMLDQATTERNGEAEMSRGIEALERARKVRRKAAAREWR